MIRLFQTLVHGFNIGMIQQSKKIHNLQTQNMNCTVTCSSLNVPLFKKFENPN
uniref:Uncharacterized protein n=1 Tax=Ciona intestinalis TaxID=7719 RepID=H2XZ92_CIOIN